MLTLSGTATSHAAEFMRRLNKAAVVGVTNFSFDASEQIIYTEGAEGITVKKGDTITIDGSTGIVYIDEMPTTAAGDDENFKTIMKWAESYKRMHVKANANSYGDVLQAQRMGAEGVGLCRTENMFVHEDRVALLLQVILSDNSAERKTLLLKMQADHQKDFFSVFRHMGTHPVSIRLFNAPLEEFLPNPTSPTFEEEVHALAGRIGMPGEVCLQRVLDLQESNPMLGFRGCRVSIVYPEITEMQTRAIVGKERETHMFNFPFLGLEFYTTAFG